MSACRQTAGRNPMAIIFCDAGLPDKFNGFQFAKLFGNWASGQFYKANASPIVFYICQRKAPRFTLIIRLDNI
jgi:hypothetical protein